MGRRLGVSVYGCAGGQTDRWMDKWTCQLASGMGRQTGRQRHIDRKTDGRKVGQMNKQTERHMY